MDFKHGIGTVYLLCSIKLLPKYQVIYAAKQSEVGHKAALNEPILFFWGFFLLLGLSCPEPGLCYTAFKMYIFFR